MVEGRLKSDLLIQIENARNNYLLGLAAMSLLISRSASEHLRISHASFEGYVVPFDQVAVLLESESDKKIALKEFLKCCCGRLLRNHMS